MKIQHVTKNGREYVMIPREEWEVLSRRRETKVNVRSRHDRSYTIEQVRMSLAEKVGRRRREAGLTQAQLAKLAGVRVETISRLENGLHMPGVKTFEKLERALNRRSRATAA